MSDKFFIRIDGPMEFLKDKSKVVKSMLDVETVAFGYHLGRKKDNPHVHIVVKLKKQIQQQTMVTRLKTLYGVKTASQYSCVIWDGDIKCYSYLYHEGETDVDVANAGLTPEDEYKIKTLIDVYKDIIVQAKQKASHKCVEACLMVIEASGTTWEKWNIGMWIMKEHREGRFYLPADQRQFAKFIDEIYLKQFKDPGAGNKADKKYLEGIFSRYFPGENPYGDFISHE